MFPLQVLADHNKGDQEKLDNVAQKEKKSKRVRVKRCRVCGLPEHPPGQEKGQSVNCIHGSKQLCRKKGNLIMQS